MICPSCGAAGANDGAICASCGRVLDPSGRLPLGYLVAGRYELRRFLGEGGMGTVYEAYDRKLEERVALKILKADFAHSVEMERRFRHEIKLARRLRHPNVCAIHEYGEAGPLRYIALELIEGADLKRRLREHGALPAAEAFRIAIQIAHGLDCIHKAGVVHRDLKTSNVMLDRNGDVRLMDFGIAKQIGGEPTVGATAVGSIIGTPEYMSPEQGRGETIDTRSDLYSLGIVVYEIFTGDVPFRGDTPIATIFKTVQEQVDLDAPQAQGIPACLKPVLLQALAKNPAERFASAEEMAAALIFARDTALGPGTTILPQQTRIEYPAIAHTPTPTPAGSRPWPGAAAAFTTPPPNQAEMATRLTPVPALAPPASTSAGPRSLVVPLLLSAVGLVLLVVGGGAILYLWPERGTPSPAAPLPTTTTYAVLTPTPVPRPSGEETPPAVARVTPKPRPGIATPGARPPVPQSAKTIVPPVAPATEAAASAAAAVPGLLQFYVKPWATVRVDGQTVGTTPMKPLSLAPGSYEVQLKHADFAPVTRRVVVESGKTSRIELDFSKDGQRLP